MGFRQQGVYLEQCLKEEVKKEDTLPSKEEGMKYSDAMVFQLINLELRNYFYRMNNFLQDKKYSIVTVQGRSSY